ncbi:hypothetical protein GY45DRAFT_1239310 [Cubamyces sp. BRFM 1775]|nr:hypothetical protein GY45DRAFT_1239310 [Cubamyces sp. BRFM 1775]
MATNTVFGVLLHIPLYVQLPPADGSSTNRHLLISVQLIEINDQHVRVETAWNCIHGPNTMPSGPILTSVPPRPGVHIFMPRDPLSMPIYVLISRFNSYGERYHIATGIQICEWIPGIIEVEAEYTSLRSRNLLRSRPICVLRANDNLNNPSPDNEERIDENAALTD